MSLPCASPVRNSGTGNSVKKPPRVAISSVCVCLLVDVLSTVSESRAFSGIVRRFVERQRASEWQAQALARFYDGVEV